MTLAEGRTLPFWRRPVALLVVMAAAMPLAFSTWNALLNNFVIQVAGFDGIDIGWLQTAREVPGFLAVLVIAIIIFFREQVVAVVCLVMLGVAVALTAQFPTFGGLIATTMIGSIGFHYYETVNQSLQLQWIDKKRAPQVIGYLVAAGSGASLLAYGTLVIGWKAFGWSYDLVYMVGGGATAVIAVACYFLYPQFDGPEPQTKKLLLRREYWLYYLLQFNAGGRRQIFVVFAAFMMVERYGFQVHQLTALFLINYVANMVIAPLMGHVVARYGERLAQVIEYSGLFILFLAYGGVYYFNWGPMVAAGLYIVDHLFFALSLAQKTYFQKIARPGDIAPTAAVSFTINHIAAVFLPASLGYVWVTAPQAVFFLAAGLALFSLCLSLLIPRHPAPGRETIFSRGPVHSAAE